MTAETKLHYRACRPGSRAWRASVLFSVVVLGFAHLAAGQQRRYKFSVKRFDMDTRRTPNYQAASSKASGSEKEWVALQLDYELEDRSDREWIDELSLTWHVGLLPSDQKPVVMQKTVTYSDVEEGQKHAVMYLRPGFVERYYGNERIRSRDLKIYLEVRINGELAERLLIPEEKPTGWWEYKEPRVHRKDADLLNRMETPFAPLDFDYYEYIKPIRR